MCGWSTCMIMQSVKFCHRLTNIFTHKINPLYGMHAITGCALREVPYKDLDLNQTGHMMNRKHTHIRVQPYTHTDPYLPHIFSVHAAGVYRLLNVSILHTWLGRRVRGTGGIWRVSGLCISSSNKLQLLERSPFVSNAITIILCDTALLTVDKDILAQHAQPYIHGQTT